MGIVLVVNFSSAQTVNDSRKQTAQQYGALNVIQGLKMYNLPFCKRVCVCVCIYVEGLYVL